MAETTTDVWTPEFAQFYLDQNADKEADARDVVATYDAKRASRNEIQRFAWAKNLLHSLERARAVLAGASS